MFTERKINEFAQMLYIKMSEDEEAKLEHSILNEGQLVPIKTINGGEILDGITRYRILCKHNIEPIFEELPSETDPLLALHAFNECRQHLSTVQRAQRALIYEEAFQVQAKENQRLAGKTFGRGMKSTGEECPIANKGRAADRAAEMVGTSRKTLQLYKSIKNSNCEELIDKVNNEDISIKLGAELAKLDKNELTKTLEMVGLKKIRSSFYKLKDNIRQQKEADNFARVSNFNKEYPSHTKRYELYCGDMIEVCDSLPNGFADAIVTDPPYVKESISLSENLGVFGKHILKDGGVMAALYGHNYLSQYSQLIEKNLNYTWTCCYLMQHGPSGLGGMGSRIFFVHWKPILVFSKGKINHEPMADVIDAGCDRHEKDTYGFRWTQSVEGTQNLVNAFANEGQTIVDPFMGVGTVGECVLRMGGKFIGIELNKERFEVAKKRLFEVAQELDKVQLEKCSKSENIKSEKVKDSNDFNIAA